MSAPSLTLAHRADLGLVIARWQREITPAELRADYLAIRVVADAAGCGHWLLDLRRRDDIIEPVVNAWFGHEFAPSLRRRYESPARLAFLVSPLRARQPIMARVSAAEADCLIATFTEEAAAYTWLTADSNGFN
ncbi:MAG: hypothetical protein EOO59_07770 [Hymenobacter sp.]|nr:MAG: hypothetical protein EOO59_07770 [Hymenobacter sp.]